MRIKYSKVFKQFYVKQSKLMPFKRSSQGKLGLFFAQNDNVPIINYYVPIRFVRSELPPDKLKLKDWTAGDSKQNSRVSLVGMRNDIYLRNLFDSSVDAIYIFRCLPTLFVFPRDWVYMSKKLFTRTSMFSCLLEN